MNYIIAFSCNSTSNTNLLLNRTTPVTWTQVTINYTAISTSPTLIFGFSTGATPIAYLDDVSVVDTVAPSVQLLDNPSFENITVNITGWTSACATVAVCNSGYPGKITNAGCHSGNCYIDHCHQPEIDYLMQSFDAIIGHIYTISFWYQVVGAGTIKVIAYIQS